jgi:hypothetical protein
MNMSNMSNEDQAAAFTLDILMGGGPRLIKHTESGMAMLNQLINDLEENNKPHITLEELKDDLNVLTELRGHIQELVDMLEEDGSEGGLRPLAKMIKDMAGDS